MNNLLIRKINIFSPEINDVKEFLQKFDLILDNDVENTIVAKIGDNIVGTCSNAGNVLKCFAVDSEIQGEGISSKLITYLTNLLFDKGIYETFIYTRPSNLTIFQGLSYKEVYATDDVVLLEGGMANINNYIKKMFINSGLSNNKKAGLVMNCNPFTLGHRYLIEKAARENDEVVVFIVEENRSLFPFEVRMDLVKRGTEDLKNVHVVSGGKYIISSTTFPSYFLRSEDERLTAYTKLDAGIFGKYIASVFNINKRYVGTEPYCRVTNRYNSSLGEVLPQYGIELITVPRLDLKEKAISASWVRNIIKNASIDELKDMVPKSTYNFLISDEAKEIIDNIKRSDSPH